MGVGQGGVRYSPSLSVSLSISLSASLDRTNPQELRVVGVGRGEVRCGDDGIFSERKDERSVGREQERILRPEARVKLDRKWRRELVCSERRRAANAVLLVGF
ncbi:hypothetical protein KFK09_002409 [Dendrobium nobile]|uniref:Uncharacterized protein n=1 Tax=Dendrobium nobile TaxID=94219 RepID=A0A8T3C187_DENNO|nr:hypothetical protein KFK09_002409 [Dendrobium nobile]